MRLPDTAHTSRPWRIHQLAPDFRLEDVWRLPCRGSADELAGLVSLIVSQDVSRSSSRAVRRLFAIRFKLGQLLRWDDPDGAPEAGGASLRDRLPVDLRITPVPEFAAMPFTALYLTDDEFAAETANRTMHGVMHIGWVPDATGGFHGQMAVLVKPNGRLGSAYMAAIRPFRRLIVYPAVMGQIERAWHRRGRAERPERAPA
jgi:hypothetical protein